jgi:UrcA family protein
MTTIRAAAFLAAALLGAAPASAASLSFAYHLDELATEPGRLALHERLTGAAREFCQIESRRSLKAFRREAQCIAEVSGTLVDRIGDARLNALHVGAAQ